MITQYYVRGRERETYNLSDQDEGIDGALDLNQPHYGSCVLCTAT